MAMFNQQYTKAVAITASDSVDFPKQGTSDNLCSAIYVGGAGVVPVSSRTARS
jgi:hypothetical protein